MLRYYVRALARHPVLYWLVAGALAAITAGVVLHEARQAESARRLWGATRAVAVAVAPIAPGQRIAATQVAVRKLPTALLPRGALRGPPVGRVALAPIVTGEVLVSARVAPRRGRGVASLLPRGTRAMAVPVGPGTPPLTVGDRVDVLATFNPEVPSDEPTFPVAERALVVAIHRETITVAVDAADAPRVALALSEATVALALRSAA